MLKASLALTASLVLVLSLGSPVVADPPFTDRAEKALAEVDPRLKRSESRSLESPAVLDPAQTVKEDVATFRSQGRVLAVMRSVGAVAPVNGDTAVSRTTRKKAARARAGARRILIYNTGESAASGLTIATWSERTGVNYQIASRGALSRAELVRLVKALPADSTKASRKARRAIESAPSAKRTPEPAQRSVSALYVDGAGDPTDDFGDEADLCNGCAYSYSNYVWLWQRILEADAFLQGSVDCSFGPLTASSTANWKKRNGLVFEGTFGVNARKLADNYLVYGDSASVHYLGEWRNVHFTRLSSAYYSGYVGAKRMNYTNATLC